MERMSDASGWIILNAPPSFCEGSLLVECAFHYEQMPFFGKVLSINEGGKSGNRGGWFWGGCPICSCPSSPGSWLCVSISLFSFRWPIVTTPQKHWALNHPRLRFNVPNFLISWSAITFFHRFSIQMQRNNNKGANTQRSKFGHLWDCHWKLPEDWGWANNVWDIYGEEKQTLLHLDHLNESSIFLAPTSQFQ